MEWPAAIAAIAHHPTAPMEASPMLPRMMAVRSGLPAGSPPSSRGPRSVPAPGAGPHPYQGTGAGGGGGFALCGDRLCRGGRLCRPADLQLRPVRDGQRCGGHPSERPQDPSGGEMSPCPPDMSRSLTWSGSRPPWGHHGPPHRGADRLFGPVRTGQRGAVWGGRRPPPAYRARFRGSRILCMS